MASIIVNAAERGSLTRVSEGTQVQLRGTRDGALFTADWYESHAMEGRMFVANMGSVTTPLTFLVTAANRPDAWIRVPDGTMILPISVVIALEDFAGTDTEMDIRMAQNDIGNGTSTAASVGPLSMRADAPYSSLCVARQLATADTTAETNPVSLWRGTISTASAAANDAAAMVTVLRGLEGKYSFGYPVLTGPASFEVFIAATTTQATGFVIFTWMEFAER